MYSLFKELWSPSNQIRDGATYETGEGKKLIHKTICISGLF
jgi:hypothetical protein